MDNQFVLTAVVNGRAIVLETPEALYKKTTAIHLAEMYFRNVNGVETVSIWRVSANNAQPPSLSLVTQMVNPVYAHG